MSVLQAPFVSEGMVDATYLREDGMASTRRLEPHAIVINWPAWYLLAFDYLRGEPRTFRFDRFTAVVARAERFAPRPREFARLVLDERDVPIQAV
jgi:predicted DNA-binding transcriptional regulator YafY